MRILFVTGEYPWSMHTFVMREVAGAIRLGADTLVLAGDRGDDAGLKHALSLGMPDQGNLIYCRTTTPPLFRMNWRHFKKPYRDITRPDIYGRRKTLFRELAGRIGQVDIVHGNFVEWTYKIAYPLSRILRATLVATVHDNLAQLANHQRQWLAELQEACAALILVSRASEELWKRRTERDDKLHTVYNGIELAEFDDRPRQGTHEVAQIISVGRMSNEKRFEEGIRIVAQLKDNGHQVHYVIVGDGPERSRLEKLVAKLELMEMVAFAGKLPHESVRKLLKEADILLHPAIDESFGVVVAEAMASFTPVVAARSGALPELIKHGETGFLYEPGHAQEALSHVKTLLRDKQRAAQMGNRGRTRVETQFSSRLHMMQVSKIWNNVRL